MWRWKRASGDKPVNKARAMRQTGSYIILALAVGATAFFGVFSPNLDRGVGPLSGAAARVGGEIIAEDEFRREYSETMRRMQQQFNQNFDPRMMQLASMVLNRLVEQRVAFLMAKKMGVQASDPEVVEILKEAEIFKDDQGRFSPERFDNFLHSAGYTESSLMAEIQRNLSVQKAQQYLTQTAFVPKTAAELDYRLNETKLDVEYLKIDPASIAYEPTAVDIQAFAKDEKNQKQIKEYYDKNPSEFNEPEKVHARHVLVSFKGARNASGEGAKRSKEDGKKRAEEILSKVKAPGADFSAIASKETDEPAGKTKGGDLGYFTRETMVKEFSDAAFPLKAGETSGVVESPFGFHIIRVEDHKPAKSETLEQASSKIAGKVLGRDRKPQIVAEYSKAVLETLKAGKPADELLKRHKIEWRSTGPFAISAKYVPTIGSSNEVVDAVLGLTTAKRLHDGIIDVSGSKYILRLKSRDDADLKKLPDER